MAAKKKLNVFKVIASAITLTATAHLAFLLLARISQETRSEKSKDKKLS